MLARTPSFARKRRLVASLISVGLVLGSLSSVGATAAPANMNAVGSVEQVYVTGLTPGASVSLLDADGALVETRTANSLGGSLFRKVTPGDGYTVESQGVISAPVTVHDDSPAPWNPSIYQQSIPSSGYSYLTTRDGTKLALTVHPPTSPAGQQGLPHGTQLPDGPAYLPPYPTLIEYSGYATAKPDGPQSGIAVLANLMGFAVVDVNIRGTGCSGGAFDFFETLQGLDGYDIVETIAAQPWVKGNKVGMLGISYGGISQLFTAQHNPPSLAAITPLAVIDATATTLYPGGNLNTGFAVEWALGRQRDAVPATGPGKGQPYAWNRIAAGDKICEENQILHGEAADLMQAIRDNTHYRPEVADPLSPVTFVHKIKVPTFLACQWQDEQTGGHCPELVRNFTGTDKAWFTFTNGPHIDSLHPDTYNRWFDFMMLYVAKEAPIVKAPLNRAIAPIVFQAAMGLPQDQIVTLPVDPVQLMPTYELALAEFEKQPKVRVLFDNGAGTSPTGQKVPGNPYAGYAMNFSDLPVPGTAAQSWYLGANGTLLDQIPASPTVSSYTSDPSALPLTNYAGGTGGGGLWGNASQWKWNWKHNPAGTAVSYMTDPLPADTTVVGPGAVYLWVRSQNPDVDLQVTVTEVRPDGNETFVQNGYQRGSIRKLSHDSTNMFKRPSTLLKPIPTYLAADASPMPSGEFVQVAVPLYYQGHGYRAGSRIRIIIAGPNGQQPVWSFGEPVAGGGLVEISSSPSKPSRLVLPVVPGIKIPTALPPCPSLRNQPCRPLFPVSVQ